MQTTDGGAQAAELAKAFAGLAEKSQRLVQQFLANQARSDGFRIPDPQVVTDAFVKLTEAMLADPGKLVQAQLQLWQQMGELWQHGMRRAAGQIERPLIEPDPADKRFKDEAWSEELVFDYVKQSYLLASRWLQGTVAEVENLDPKIKGKAEFYTRQLVDALSPTNFALTNPAVLKRADRDAGRKPAQGPAAIARRSRARQWRSQDLDDQRGGLQGRRKHRRLAGQSGVRERADAAGPIRADDSPGPRTAPADRAAMDQ